MCSITDQRLAMIGTAIDDLAEAARAEAARAGASHGGTAGIEASACATMAARLAGIWAMVADLDPALAHRLSHYTGQPATGQPATGQPATGRNSSAQFSSEQGTPDPGHA